MKRMLMVVGVLIAATMTAAAIPPQQVPDAGATALLLGLVLGGLSLIRR